MSLVAAFLWTKSPQCSISTMIFDDETIHFLSIPKIQYFPKNYVLFRKYTRNAIKKFFAEIKKLHKMQKKPVRIEFKIVFNVNDIPYLTPARESKYVYKVFGNFLQKTTRNFKSIKIQPQLRNRLSGKHLKHFKQELRSLYLVSRKRHTGYEYHLWTVALHATAATYVGKLRRIRSKLEDAMWNNAA